MTACHVCLAAENASPDNLAELVRYLNGRCDRLATELLEARVQVADGPRGRVRELELTVARLNQKIAELNGRRR